VSGATISVAIDSADVTKLLEGIASRGENLRPAYAVMAETVRTSVVKNFEEGGRPVAWAKGQKATGKTLIESTRLVKSITPKATDTYAEVGTNVKYAAIHQFGFDGEETVRVHMRRQPKRDVADSQSGVRPIAAHKRHMNMPARPFLVIQDGDWDTMENDVLDYIAGGK